VMEFVGQHFRPEFINRIDDVVVFHPLIKSEIRQIVTIQLASLQKRLSDRDITLHLTDAALDQLAEAGFDPVYGARPLKRALQQRLENTLAQEILTGAFGPGDTITVDAGEPNLRFSK
jgi:ATP-dependent Clp protease ATP-binding subunit ClpB